MHAILETSIISMQIPELAVHIWLTWYKSKFLLDDGVAPDAHEVLALV